MATKQHTLLIDGNAVAYTIQVINSQYVNDKKDFCRQYLGRLREYAKQFSTINTKAILFFDDKFGNWREKLYPDYQKTRKVHTEQQQYEIDLRKQYLDYVKQKFNKSQKYMYLSYPSTETDDLVALYCKNVQQDGEMVTILTTDKDLYQLINEDLHKPVRVLQIIKRKLITSEKEGKEALNRKILLGDNSDSIPGICKNVGEKSIDDFMVFLNAMEENDIDPTDKEKAKRISESLNIKYTPSYSNYSKEQHETNKKLIDLNYVVELDAENGNKKTQYLVDNAEKAKFSPGSLYSFSSLF